MRLAIMPFTVESFRARRHAAYMALAILAALAAGLLTAGPALASTQATFAPARDFQAGSYPVFVTNGDFNSDGETDFVTSNSYDNTVSVLLGNSDGTYQAPQSFQAYPSTWPDSTGIRDVATGDFNSDQKTDLAVAVNDSTNTIALLLGNGDGTFQTAQNIVTGSPTQYYSHLSVISADFNGDGKADLATTNFQSKSVSVLLGNGDGTFQTAQTFGTGSSNDNTPVSVTSADFNGDGNPDLAVASNYSDEVAVLLNDPNNPGTFQAAQTFGTGTNDDSPVSVISVDFNGDGKADLATANNNTNDVSLLLGNNDGTFQTAQKFDTRTDIYGTSPRQVISADFNGDGKADLATANNYTNDVSVLLGNNDGTFQTAQKFKAGTGAYSLASGNFDGDTKTDLAVANVNDSTVSVLLNTTTAAPTTEDGLVAYYPFSGDTKDASGNGHDGTLEGGANNFPSDVPSSGAPSSLSFDGSDDAVSVPDDPALDFGASNPMTISLWAKKTSSAGLYHILGKREGCGLMNYQLARDSSGFHFNSQVHPAAQVSTSVNDLTQGEWTHLAVTHDNTSSTLNVYADGELVGSDDSYELGTPHGDPMMIGASGTCGNTFPGLLDEVRIYNRALSATEIGGLAEPTPSDNTKPTLDLPSDMSVEATDSSGAVVSYTVTATDDKDETITPTCTPASGSTFPIGPTPVNCSATDAAGNKADGSFTVTVKDSTGPTISGMPSDITQKAASNSGETVSYTSPTANDAVDGSVNVSCSPASGSTFGLGTTTVSCSATDNANNTTTKNFQVNVVYDFGQSPTGGIFAEPVDQTALNRVPRAGLGVPVKFSLGGDFGLNIFAQNYPASKPINCATQQPTDLIEETVAISTSGLKYDPTNEQYVYGWKTDKAWTGTCRQLVLKFADGTSQAVNFQFTK